MATSPVPSSQTFATQKPELRVAGRHAFADALITEVASERIIGSVAAAGTNQATAGLIPQKSFVQVTAADGTKGVVLPACGAGVEIAIHNVANAVLKIYPHAGGDINDGSANAALSIAAKSQARFVSLDGVTWSASFEPAP